MSQRRKRGWQVAGALIAAGIVITFVATRTPEKSPASAATAPSTAVTTKMVTATSITPPSSSGMSTPQTAAHGIPPVAQTTIATAAVVAQPTVKLAAMAAGRPLVATKTYSGKGNGTVKVDLGGNPAVLTFACPACSGKTTVTTDGALPSLVDRVGPYRGAHLLDATTAAATGTLTVTASSAWTITVADVRTVKAGANSVSGHGDAVVRLSGVGAVATVANTGTSDFLVIGYGGTYPQQAVHQIGTFKGTVVLSTPGYLQVESDGDWTITTTTP